MKICALICEFNPFHVGHKYILHNLRQQGATHIVCIMSGSFVQRAYPAMFSKWARAEAALNCGADLVVELPLPYAVDTADRFAFGGASIIKSMGVFDAIGFGCETENPSSLVKIAEALSTEEFSLYLRDYLKEGMSFASAREKALSRFEDIDSTVLDSPNNILGVEYIRHLLDTDIEFLPVKRKGAEHHSMDISGTIASATSIRENWGKNDVSSLMPEKAYEIFKKCENEGHILVNNDKFEIAMLSFLRRLSADDIAKLPNVSEGLEYRFYDAIQNSTSLDELYDLVKSKRYSHSRIRRIALSGFLGIEKGLSEMPVPYIRVLGATEKGMEVLSLAKKKSAVPVSNSIKKIMSESSICKRFAELEILSTNQYNIMIKKPEICSSDYKCKFIKA